MKTSRCPGNRIFSSEQQNERLRFPLLPCVVSFKMKINQFQEVKITTNRHVEAFMYSPGVLKEKFDDVTFVYFFI